MLHILGENKVSNNNNNNNSNGDILPIDNLFSRFFNLGGLWKGEGKSRFDTTDLFGDFEDIHKEMNRTFNVFNNISTNTPKELIREYETKEGDKVREVGPIVYGYSMTIGPDGKPHVREFGNIKPLGNAGSKNNIGQYLGKPSISAEREPLSDITSTAKEVKVVLEMPGIKKEDIKINAYESKVEVKTEDSSSRKYHKTVDLPKEADIETARSTYNNGILEVTFDKKKETKAKGKEIKIE
jgi:HSP20 family protein